MMHIITEEAKLVKTSQPTVIDRWSLITEPSAGVCTERQAMALKTHTLQSTANGTSSNLKKNKCTHVQRFQNVK